jgi:predicted house-cleaning noncanonical NTP pyrophosphatase (MazG superfamily)
VDTRDVLIERTNPGTKLKYDSWERLRYKGTFIAPDAAGKWIPYQSIAPFEWRPTISRRDWLFEIAHATRLIAEDEKFPVAVMWFIGNHPEATPHRVLPWFHNRSELGQAPKAAPRRKITFARDFKLQDASDWNTLKDQVAAGKPVERVIVEPTDCDLIRNQDFTLELANFAAANNIVIELAGGVLSHAYYVLHRQCAQVECTDLFGAEEDILEYNKLVRDRIPAIIEARGERVEVAQLTGDALTSALRQKLVEEALEALDANSGDDLVGELADLEEVISGLKRALGLTKDQIETERTDKKRRRGGFQRGYMLKTTATPHSLERKPVSTEATLDLKPKGHGNAIISRSEDIPSAPTYRRPDLRQHEHEIEKLFAFESEIKRVTDVTETMDFSLPGPDGNSQQFSLIVEIRRKGASLRSSVRLRLRPSQLMMDFPDNQLKLNFPKKD